MTRWPRAWSRRTWLRCADDRRRLRGVRPGGLPEVDLSGQRVGAPIARPGVVLCIGMTYAAHAAESGSPPPTVPITFYRAPNTVVWPDDDVLIPRDSPKTDWEVELAVVIGRTARYLDSPRASVRPHRRIRHLQRGVRTLLATQGQWRAIVQGQGPRELQPARSMAGDARRDTPPRPARAAFRG